MNSTIHEVIIIGAGPAGIACAIQLKRSGIESLLFEKNIPGGLLYNANLVENYPGFPSGIPGYRLAGLIKKQLLKEKIKVIKAGVSDVKFLNNKFIVSTSKGIFNSKYLAVASGTQPKKPDDGILSRTASKKILYDIYKIRNIANKNIIIIGAGDLAFDYALNLGKRNQITILNRASEVNCIPLLYKRAIKLKNIKIINDAVVKKIEMQGKQFEAEYLHDKKGKIIISDKVIAAIGREPVPGFLPGRLNSKLKKSNKLFIIGDAANKQYRQVSIAAGDGVKAAMIISENMKGLI